MVLVKREERVVRSELVKREERVVRSECWVALSFLTAFSSLL